MTKGERLEGVVIALPTPLTKDENIDIHSLRRLLDHCIREGANGIMLLGTMGEGTALLASQRRILVEETVSHVAGRTSVLATISAPSTRKAISYAKDIEKSGVSYIVCTTPFYYKFPDPRSVLMHIETIADAVDVPLIFYNASGMTGNPVDADTTEKILNMEKVAGVKDSSGHYSNFVELLRRYPDKEKRPGTIMQGDESVFDSSLLMGADGIISGAGVIFLKQLTELYEAAIRNDRLLAMELQSAFYRDVCSLLGPHPDRDWLANIKKKLVDINIIADATVTAPFLLD
jgi:4-hydroxy-tetrahydrodipicolinate synthase